MKDEEKYGPRFKPRDDAPSNVEMAERSDKAKPRCQVCDAKPVLTTEGWCPRCGSLHHSEGTVLPSSDAEDKYLLSKARVIYRGSVTAEEAKADGSPW